MSQTGDTERMMDSEQIDFDKCLMFLFIKHVQQTILQAFLSSLVYKMFECVLFKLKRMFPSMTINIKTM